MDQSALELAVETNDVMHLQSAIDKGVDINEQNADGNTALHLAISGNAGFEILKLLLMNGSSVKIRNNDGYNPLQLIDPQSTDTFLNLFRLEHYIDYSGGVGNTIMHLMMMTDTADTLVWDTILEEFPNLHIDFNAQNEIGQTPLHIASSRTMGIEDLKFMLSSFENLNLLLVDKNGDTFLHTFLSNLMDDEYHVPFLADLFEGKFKFCPKAVLKQLLRIKNFTGHTPLHICINDTDVVNVDVLRIVDILKMFLKAGAEIDSNNIYGENILHALVRCFPDQPQLVECAVANCGEVNVKNGFGETPIFFTDDRDIIQILLNAGADVKIKNKVGKTPLMAQMLKAQVKLDVVELLLENGSDANAVDIHGNSVLHFAAWNDVGTDVINLLKRHGAKIVLDKMGQRPCESAQKRGHMSLINELCVCEKGVNVHSDEIKFPKGTIPFQELFEPKSEPRINTCAQERSIIFQASTMPDVLRIPGLGSIVFEEEADEVKNAVTYIIQNICEEIGRKDEMLSNSIFQSGSVGENTKVGLPDEFDYVCILDRFSSICEVDEDESVDDPGYAYVKLKPEFRKDDQYRYLFNQNCYLDTEGIRQRFLTTLSSVMQNPALCCHANVVMELCQFKESQLAPNCQLILRWTRCEYKDIQINVDLVPACRISGWWPPNAKLDRLSCKAEEVRNEGALLLLQATFDEDYEPVTKLRVSALTAEKMHMKNLPQLARDAYMMTKILCDERVCPRVNLSKNSGVSLLRSNITSYMLKNCLFHVTHDGKIANSLKTDSSQTETKNSSSQTLHEYVCKIFGKFQQCIADEKLPSFIFPWQDVFTFQDIECDIFPEQNHMKCVCRSVYTKLILNRLGQVETFADIDVNVINSA